jgi:UDP-glucose-4-epimerase GalE
MADSATRPILIAGGAGYIGSHTVRLFEQRGLPVVVLDDLSNGFRELVPNPETPFEQVDLKDREALDGVFAKHRPLGVVHFAAKSFVGESVSNPSKYYHENVHGTWCLLEAMRAHECRDIVFSSTCATYGDPVRIPMDDEHPQQPISPYGRSKLHIEHMLDDFTSAYGLRFAALRYFNAAGASPDGDIGEWHDPETHLIPLVLQTAAGVREEILIFGDDYDTPDGTCIRDYIHVDDLAEAHLSALELLQGGRERFFCNLGTGAGFSVREVIDTARQVTGCEIAMRVVERRAGDPPQLVSGGTRAADELGWTPRRTALADIVRDAWNFRQRNPDRPAR